MANETTNINIPPTQIAPGINSTGGVATTPVNVVTPQSLQPQTSLPPLANNQADPSIYNANNVLADLNNGVATAQSNYDAALAQAQSSSSDISNLISSLGGQAQDTINTYNTTGVTSAFNQVKDLQAQAQSLNLEAQAIPIQVQEQFKNTGATDKGIAPVTTGKLRENALKAISLGQQYAIASGNYEKAKNYADQLITVKYAQIEADIKAKQFNLEALDKYTLTPAQNKLKEAQLAKLKKEEELLAESKAQESAVQNLALTAISKGGAPGDIMKQLEGKSLSEAITTLAPYLATTETDIVKLDNGNTIMVDKKTGKVLQNYGGGTKGGVPSVVARTVAGTPVTGYTLIAGDDPYFIAQQYGISVDQLKKLNPNVKDWNNIQIGATLNVPQAEQDAFLQYLESTKGGKELVGTTINKLEKGLTVLDQLGTLQANIAGVKTGPILGLFKGANPWDTQAQTIKASLNAIIPNLARGVYGEVGVLTDNDIAQYSKTIPNLKSTEEIRNAVMYITLDMIGKSIQTTLKVNAAAGRDVSGFADIYTEMQAAKNSILSQIPNAQVPQAFQSQNQDSFLSQFSAGSINSNISNSSFFNQF